MGHIERFAMKILWYGQCAMLAWRRMQEGKSETNGELMYGNMGQGAPMK